MLNLADSNLLCIASGVSDFFLLASTGSIPGLWGAKLYPKNICTNILL